MDSALSSHILSGLTPLMGDFLDSSRVIHLMGITSQGSFRFVNDTVAALLKKDRKELRGRRVFEFMTRPDADRLSLWLSGGQALPDDVFVMNVVDSENIPHSLNCRISWLDDLLVLVGEPPQSDNLALQEELLQLNNQLAVLSRENIRKGRELAKALAELKQTQAMLVHQEKMASLGQMTAGIAHEINTPIAYVMNNESILKRDFDDLLEFINTLGDALPEIEGLSSRIHSEIIQKAEAIGLEHLAEAIPRKISANIEGLDRVKKIVLDLRNFSRLDEAERKLSDLAEGIQSTLRFLGPLIQEHDVRVETELAPLPLVLCSPGPLNQAIHNIIANAIQASCPGQVVRVSTDQIQDEYCISVIDQGAGISPEHQSRVFDPFFTTKPVGSGTGLGLSIAHQVVAAHGGRIEIDSQVNQGTTVRILLPRRS